MKESELVKKAQKGDSDAFCELYNLYKNRLYKYAYYRLSNANDAEDAVMDCVLSAYSQIHKLKKADAFSSWIFKILHSSCIKYIDLQALSDSQSDLSLDLKNALNLLNNDEKDIVLLCAVAGFTSKECSKIIGLKPSSVRSKLSRSLAKMRNYLE